MEIVWVFSLFLYNYMVSRVFVFFFFFQAEDGIRDGTVTEFRRVLFRSPCVHAVPASVQGCTGRARLLLLAGGPRHTEEPVAVCVTDVGQGTCPRPAIFVGA